MRKPSFCVLVVQSTLLSLLSSQTLSAYQLPDYGNHKQLDTKNNIQLVNRNYTPAQINYFFEIALGSEFGSSNPTIKKWDRDIKIKVNGSPTAEDLKTLQTVLDEINTLTNSIKLQIDAKNPNLEIYFVPESQFAQYEPNYSPVNYGFFWTDWDNDAIYNSRVLISTIGLTQKERSHLIREELTQSLGLMKDSYIYQESIFYQGWTDVTDYSDLDKAVIQMLTLPEIRPGMTKSQVLEVLQKLEAKKEPISNCGTSDADPALDFSVDPFCSIRFQ
ncbi:DUF2927 domain-containing protein [Microcoleus sp. FACHB-SPT15]|uniref:DUF2927 domain-containing protein n=1 Tax=Microcoleus sp. FACHB-SPT15 TaxID=2692830 RepID=UPI00177B2197|nr:DUF2927 domain-containing protein [Microcoleus sp. FACHB-SPT15]MBD1805645.1 DUF2927 domain-containing protein [Microcoleus sp. FACHB-SPT15]